MDEPRKIMIRRRDVLRLVTAAAAVAGAGAASVDSAETDATRKRDKRKPQYQANSREVQAFYRVNRYPEK
ncbi:MAG: hypothetical protein QOI88_2570 [Gammaproteobacteria bacterium]|nr:hypothetical protein [Gammaproteobacteria bacterium]